MIERFCKTMERLVPSAGRYRYLLAVSGGADSTVMAFLFRQAGLPFAIAHCNFHLRGADSDRDMEMVRTMAARWEVPLFVKEFDTLQLQRDSGLSVEMMARKLRYDWFNQIGGDFDFIVTAHHANDAAETMLLNLCRGTGLKGLSSIPERNGKLLRPMLEFSAREIRDFAQAHQLQYAIDCTNAYVTIPRNRIRHEVIPTLEQINPALIDTMSRNRAIFQKQLGFYQKQIDQIKKKAVVCHNDTIAVNKSFLADHPDKSLLLYEILSEYGFSFSVVQNLEREVPTGRQFFSPTHVLVVDREEYLVQPLADEVAQEVQIRDMDALKQHFGVEKLQWTPDTPFPRDNHTLLIPAEKLLFPLVLRFWREGDAFHPLGAKGRQKLSDYFSDHKFDRLAKRRVRLLCHDDDILWIVGHRSSERFKIDSNTTYYYKITDYGNL
ncbi:MAG: tRNA lysidine(34) synthetase TilS [Bacteroidales bacterium]|nr:tRNA lysidine(34) synthetase TilS [Bacteroidales bacterium]